MIRCLTVELSGIASIFEEPRGKAHKQERVWDAPKATARHRSPQLYTIEIPSARSLVTTVELERSVKLPSTSRVSLSHRCLQYHPRNKSPK